jgi:large subunit ribosomal protein L1
MDKKDITHKIKEAQEKSGKKNFKQTLELSMHFKEIDLESQEYKLNLNILLPKGRGKDIVIGVFADGDMNIKAKKITDKVLSRAELEEYAKNKRKMRRFATDCYTIIAQPDMMGMIGKTWGIVLGPRGKMPQPVPENADLVNVFSRIKNTVRIKSKKNPTIQVPVGVEDMTAEDLAENVFTVLNAVERQIPKENIASAYVKTTMGQPVRLM